MHYDLIIVGLGAMGSAALYQAAKAGVNVLGIDQFSPPHEMGSSHAETRVTRMAVGEGMHYVPLVARSHEIWRELENATGQKLFFQTGGYIIAPQDSSRTKDSHWNGFVERTATVANAAGIPFELRNAVTVREQLPFVLVRDSDQIGYEPSGGIILCERAIDAQLGMAKQYGAAVHFNEAVIDIKVNASHVAVITASSRIRADRVIVNAGAWMPDFMPQQHRGLLRVTRQVVYWFEVVDPSLFSIERFPFIIWLGDTPEDYFAIFPMSPHGVPGLKILTEQFKMSTYPDSVARTVTRTETDHFYREFVMRKVEGVVPNCVRSTVCLYTNTPDEHFIVDFHPESDRIVLASPCSGHGFKHSAAIGEAMVQLVTAGHSKIDLAQFSLGRFAPSTGTGLPP